MIQDGLWWFAPATVALIAWGALAFGAEYAWAYAPLLVFSLTVGVLGLTARVRAPGPPRAVVRALGLVLAAGVMQVAPLPDSVLATISPAKTDHDFGALYDAAVVPALEPDEVGRGATASISVSPERTLLGLAFLTALSLFFLGCIRALNVVRASQVVRGAIAVGLIVALVAIVQKASGSELVYGLWLPRKAEPLPAAPFVNPNHVAGWMVMVLSLAVGHLRGGVALGRRRRGYGLRRRILWLGSRDGSETLLVGLAVLIMTLSIVMVMSVSGLACLVLVCLVFGWWTTRESGAFRWRAVRLAVLMSVPLAAVAWVGFDVVGYELAATSWSDIGGRVGIWRDTLRIIGDFPLTGTGFNTYGVAMLAHQTYRADVHAVEAHNDYLQLFAEGGVLVGLPILFAVAVFAREVRRRFHEADDDVRIYWLRAGAVTGLVAVAFQELVDFSLQMPGNAVLFALLMAIAVHRPSPARMRPQPGSR